MTANELRTVRAARLAIREAERAIDGIRMSPAASLVSLGDWYLRSAQAKLRQAERKFAKADDPRLEPLKPLAPTVARAASTRPRRRRYRCATCMREELWHEEYVAQYPMHCRVQRGGSGYVREDCGAWQLVARLPKGKAKT